MDNHNHPGGYELPGWLKSVSVDGRYRFLARLGVFWVTWIGVAGIGSAIANVLPLPDALLAQEQVTADDVRSTCGPIPIDAYVPHDSAALKQSFCKLLTFSPFSLSSIDSFLTEIVPESLSSDDAPSPEEMTLPSLWWSRDSLPRQFGSYRLVDSWTAYEIREPALRVIDVHVNPQIWRILKYSERYGALTHLAKEAGDYQYNLRLYYSSLRAPRLIGLYVCDFPFHNAMSNPDSTGFDTTAECVATVDADSIARLQDSLESFEEVAQSTPTSQPSDYPAELEAAPGLRNDNFPPNSVEN